MTDFTYLRFAPARRFAAVFLLALSGAFVSGSVQAEPARPLKSKPAPAVRKTTVKIVVSVENSGKAGRDDKAEIRVKGTDGSAKDGDTKPDGKTTLSEDEIDLDETTYRLIENEPTGDRYTSVIIDASDYHVTPSMSPKVCRADGAKVWPTLAYIDPDYVISYGIVVYAHSLEEAKSHKRAGKNPLVVRATGHGKSADDPVVSEADALLLLAANKRNGCMDKFKVIYILDKRTSEARQ